MSQIRSAVRLKISGRGAKQGRQRSDHRIGARLKTPRSEWAAWSVKHTRRSSPPHKRGRGAGETAEAGETSSNVDPPGVQIVARRSGRRDRRGAGANAPGFINDAVIVVKTMSSGVGRTTSARIEGRLQRSVRGIFPAKLT